MPGQLGDPAEISGTADVTGAGPVTVFAVNRPSLKKQQQQQKKQRIVRCHRPNSCLVWPRVERSSESGSSSSVRSWIRRMFVSLCSIKNLKLSVNIPKTRSKKNSQGLESPYTDRNEKKTGFSCTKRCFFFHQITGWLWARGYNYW